MKELKWCIIGMNLYIFPPDPAVGDIKALREWKPKKYGFFTTLKLRWKLRYWGYTTKNF